MTSAVMGLRRAVRRQFRPDGPLKVNWSSPHARQLVALVAPSSAHNGNLVNLVTGKLCTHNGGAPMDTGNYGRQLNLHASSGYDVTISNPAQVKTAGRNISVLVECVPAVVTRGDVVSQWNNGANSGDLFDCIIGITSGKFRFYSSVGSGSTQNSGDSSQTLTAGMRYVLGGCQQGTTTIRCYVNGVLGHETTTSLTLINANPATAVKIGNNNVGDAHFDGQVLLVAIWDRFLFPETWAELGTNPGAHLLAKA